MKFLSYLTGMLCVALVAIVLAQPATAGVDDREYSLKTTGSGTSSTNAKRYAVHGMVEAIHVDVPTSATGAVLVITADGQTLLSVAAAIADAVYYPRTPVNGPLGAALFAGATTNVTRFPVSGIVTGRVIGASFQTNTYRIRLITSD